MKLSGLVIVFVLSASTILLAQHSGTSGSSSGSSPSSSSPSVSSSSSASSGGFSNAGASHSGSSGGASSSAPSVSSHGGGAASTGGHGSAGSATSGSAHNSSGSASHVDRSGSLGSHTTVQGPHSSGEPALREPNGQSNRKGPGETAKMSPPSTAKLPAPKSPPTAARPAPEKKGFFSFLRHPFRRKPPRTAVLPRPTPCKKEPCKISCPPGESRNGKGVCAAPVVASNQCEPGQIWNGAACAATGETCPAGQIRVGVCRTDCTGRTAGSESWIMRLRSARQQRDEACRQDRNGPECREAEASYDIRLNEYKNFLGSVPTECRAGLPDPIAI